MPTKEALKSAREDLNALQADLPTIEGLLDKHRDAFTEAKAKGADFTTLAELQAKVHGFESVLSQHRADVANAETQVRTLEADLERDRACERVKSIYKELDSSKQPWEREVLTAINTFIETAVTLGNARRDLMGLHKEASRLRDQLTQEATGPTARAALLKKLDILPPPSVLNESPFDWLPTRLTAPLDAAPARLVTSFEGYMTVPNPDLDRLSIKPKETP